MQLPVNYSNAFFTILSVRMKWYADENSSSNQDDEAGVKSELPTHDFRYAFDIESETDSETGSESRSRMGLGDWLRSNLWWLWLYICAILVFVVLWFIVGRKRRREDKEMIPMIT